MAIERRKYLYKRETVDRVKELDLLNTDIPTTNFSVSDEIVVTDSIAFNPSMCSMKAFGTFELGWLLMDYNDILDPYEELTIGTRLKVPSIQEFFRYFNNRGRAWNRD